MQLSDATKLLGEISKLKADDIIDYYAKKRNISNFSKLERIAIEMTLLYIERKIIDTVKVGL